MAGRFLIYRMYFVAVVVLYIKVMRNNVYIQYTHVIRDWCVTDEREDDDINYDDAIDDGNGYDTNNNTNNSSNIITTVMPMIKYNEN